MKLKKFLKLLYPDTKVIVVRDYETIPKPSDYRKCEDLKVVALRIRDHSDELTIHVSSNGFYYDSKEGKYMKY